MAKSLGRFEIDGFIAAGGMGEVFRGRHIVAGTASAIKIVTGGALHQSALLREVRAAASLNHPGIVDVFDYGRVTETESLASDGAFPAGALWLAMEYADCGSLEQIRPPDNFESVRRILLDVLDALAHAHARDLVHRDLKPANMLLSRRPEGLTLLLADFGIAHVRATGGNLPETTDTIAAPAAGTPRYMAPEQIHGDWRDQGPWTDLYALGCMAWEFVTGEPPFDGDSSLAVAMAHLHNDPGVFEPLFDVPDHFEPWVRRCLEKHRRDRFQFAADAAQALGPGQTDLEVVLGGISDGPMTLTSTQIVGIAPQNTRRIPSVELHAIRRKDLKQLADAALHIPADWRPVREPPPLGRRTELGLFGLRELPLLGLDPQRDQLWEQLRLGLQQTVRFAICTGSEGRGKTRLLQWLGRRAMELGIATALRISHTREAGPLHGMLRCLEDYFGCTGLSHAKTLERLSHRLDGVADETLQRELASLFAPSETAPTHIRFESAVERYDVLCRAMVAETQNRPLVLLFDDAQWDVDVLAFCENLAAKYADQPIFVALSLNPHAVDEDSRLARRLRPFMEATTPCEVQLEPLTERDHLAIARQQFGLARPLALSLVEASKGDLAFTMCVFADWIDRGVLRAEEVGWTFGHSVVEFPRSLEEAWGARLDRFCARFAVPERIHQMLSLAAVLGIEFDTGDWARACEFAGVGDPSALVEAFADAALGSRSQDRLYFASSAAVGVLLSRAADRSQLSALHRACAAATSSPAQQASHLFASGDAVQGLVLLRPAVLAALQACEYETAVRLADVYLAQSPNPTAPDALEVRATRADALRFLGESEHAEAEAQALLGLGQQGAPGAVGQGLRILAGLEHARGDLELGIARYSDSLTWFARAHDTIGASKAHHGRGWLRLTRGDFAAAAEDFDQAARLAATAGSSLDAAWSHHGLAEAMVYLKDARALELADRALKAFERLGSRSGRGMALTTLGNAYRAERNFEAARESYEAGAAQLNSLRSHLIAFNTMHRAASELMAKDLKRLAAAIDEGKENPPPAFRLVLDLLELATQRGTTAEKVSRVTASKARFHPLVPALLRQLATILPPSDMDLVWQATRSLSPQGD